MYKIVLEENGFQFNLTFIFKNRLIFECNKRNSFSPISKKQNKNINLKPIKGIKLNKKQIEDMLF